MTDELGLILEALISLQQRLRSAIRQELATASSPTLSEVSEESSADTIYRIDQVCDALVLESLSGLARKVPLILIAEGIADRPLPLPEGTSEEDCRYRIILDPIDGTRMIMFDKRSAWSLAGVAPNLGSGTDLRDIRLAVMTELPPSKQTLSDTFYGLGGQGVRGWRENLSDGSRRALRPSPSTATDFEHGFAQFVKFFPGGKALLAEWEERLFQALGLFEKKDRVVVFDDQYLSSGGQIYELLMGHDRFVADLRKALRRVSSGPAPAPGLAAHPYDLCVELIGREAGLVMIDPAGNPLTGPLDTTTDLDWIGFANRDLFESVFPHLESIFREAKLR